MLQKFKDYQNQIWAAIRRFPVVAVFALYTTVSYITAYLLEYRVDLWREPLLFYNKLFCWIWLYPISAMLIAYAFTLRDEVLQKRSVRPHVIAQIAWLLLSLLNAHFLISPVNESLFAIESIILASPFILPFWKKTNDLGIWKFIGANIKAAVIAVLTTGILNGAVAFLFFALNTLFDTDFSDDTFVISAIVCWALIFPILFLSGIPELANRGDNAINADRGENGEALNCADIEDAANLKRSKFAMNSVHFLFIPIYLLYIGFLYAYGIKIILFDAEYGMVSLFAFIAMFSTLVITTILYPSHFDPARKLDKKILVALPLLNIPLVIFMAIDFFNQVVTDNLEKSAIYTIHLFAWFLAVIAISSFVVRKKIRWLVISFCIAVAIATIGPLSAKRITYNLTVSKLTEILNQKGFTEFPLSCEQYRQFGKSLSHEYDTTTGGRSEMVRFMNVRYEVRSIGGEKALEQFFEHENCGEFETDTAEDRKEKIPEINYAASDLITVPYDIPKNRSKAFPLELYINEDNIEIKDSVLLFNLQPFPDDTTTVYAYSVPLDTLKIRDSKETCKPLIADDGKSTLVMQNFSFSYKGDYRRLHLNGTLYLQ